MNKKLEFWGGICTAIYLSILGTTVYVRFSDFVELSLNELGDFLAGAFGPVAFFWLVLGFLQQGRELRLSSEALKLQAQELRSLVDNQKFALQPVIELYFSSVVETETGPIDSFVIVNRGGYCRTLDAKIIGGNLTGDGVTHLGNIAGGTERQFNSSQALLADAFYRFEFSYMGIDDRVGVTNIVAHKMVVEGKVYFNFLPSYDLLPPEVLKKLGL